MRKICPRCGAEFECLHDERMQDCHCARVRLTREQLVWMGDHYDDCLCHDCLLMIQSGKWGENLKK